MTTNFRALAQELNTLLVYVASTHPDLHETVRRAVLYCHERARTELATPPPKPPTDEEIHAWVNAMLCAEAGDREVYGWGWQCFTKKEFARTIRAALERWGHG